MTRYHLNPVTGSTGKCSAEADPCPFGGEDKHFPTAELAMEHFEELMAGMTLPEPTRAEVRREQAIQDLEASVINDRRTELFVTDSSATTFANGTIEDLEATLPPGTYGAHLPTPERGLEAVRLEVRDGSALARRVPDPVSTAEKLVAGARAGEERSEGETVRTSPLSLEWLEDEGLSSEVFEKKSQVKYAATEMGELSRLARQQHSPITGEAIEDAAQALAQLYAAEDWHESDKLKEKARTLRQVGDKLDLMGISMVEDEPTREYLYHARGLLTPVLDNMAELFPQNRD